MRIIRGKYKGRKINAPKSVKARPTTDFAKESLFNILNNQIDFEDIEVLDLFAGTGNISFEFASRGAASVLSVDHSFTSVKFIQHVSEELELPVRAIKAKVFGFLENHPGQYDIIFADPPYQLKNLDMLPDAVLSKKLLKPDGVFILEHGKENDFSNNEYLVDHRIYSRVNFSFFKYS